LISTISRYSRLNIQDSRLLRTVIVDIDHVEHVVDCIFHSFLGIIETFSVLLSNTVRVRVRVRVKVKVRVRVWVRVKIRVRATSGSFQTVFLVAA